MIFLLHVSFVNNHLQAVNHTMWHLVHFWQPILWHVILHYYLKMCWSTHNLMDCPKMVVCDWTCSRTFKTKGSLMWMEVCLYMVLAQLDASVKGRNIFIHGPWPFYHSNLLYIFYVEICAVDTWLFNKPVQLLPHCCQI